MSVVPHEELEKVYIKLIEQCNERLSKLYSELSDEEKNVISFRKFASYHTIDYDVEYPEDVRELPKVTVVLRLKTVEELMGE